MRSTAIPLLAAAMIALGGVGASIAPAPALAQTVRPDVGRPLQAAGEMVRAQRFREALAKVREADAVPNKTAAETSLIERMRLAAASGAGEMDTAAHAFEAVSGQLAPPDRLRSIESLAGGYYRA
jgi:hypothetical protein